MTEMPVPDEAQRVVDYWRDAGEEGQWFRHDPAFDRDFRERFLALHEAAARGERDGWAVTPTGLLALLILLDQFPRNAFRGTARMYATDARARHWARQAQAVGAMDGVEPALQLFFCLPFAHSEDLADQDLSVELNQRLGSEARRHAEGHRDIVRRFGRFPHRNPLLGRETTEAEAAFLRAGGFAG
ncbi:DUF924 family protein [Hydrogenophaga sp. NFH-34]|uniref:DUF924 family protein n=1 Tax=Hydrogenophaga sp. NFH-34 TaxID=2744446 RepID=UPI001F44BF93|nr:DUF924 family protein [Hydrogenophaga sp. NFH-34]